jgi:hypothetical protein
LAQRVLTDLGGASSGYIDDAYSELLAAYGVPIMSVNRSRLQHLGIIGLNNRYYGELEHGLNFRADAPRQMEAIAAVFDELMSRQELYLRPR